MKPLAASVAMVSLDIPDFAGELRLMAVAWEGTRIGSGARALTVRDQVVAEALLPRFLAPGDEARLSVLLHNIELPQGEIAAELTATGGLAIAGPTRLAASKIFCMALGFTVASGAALAAAVAALCPSADLPARERHEESMPRPLGLPSSLSPSWLAAFRA